MLFEDKSNAIVKKAMGNVSSVYGPFQIEGIKEDIFVSVPYNFTFMVEYSVVSLLAMLYLISCVVPLKSSLNS